MTTSVSNNTLPAGLGENPKVAVVILCWNGKKYLEEFLPQVLQNTHYPNTEIVVADNCSTDGTREFVQEKFPEVGYVFNAENNGFAQGYNDALKQVEADIYVLLNQDATVAENWVAPVVDMMKQDPWLAAAQPKVIAERERERFEHAGASGGFLDKWGYPFCRGRLFFLTEEDQGQYDDPVEIFWATGACMFVRADLYWKAGGLDNDFFAHMEEIDLCWRIKNMGYSIKCIPSSVAYHVGGGSLSYDNPKKAYLNFRNSLIMLIKNLPPYEALYIIPIRFALDFLALVRMGTEGNVRAMFAVSKAHRQFLYYFPKWYKKRREAKKLWDQPNLSGTYPKSLVWEFFGKGKKKFSDLNWKP
ncbi:glycosyltransferase family 2 protein [bacterium SCSIO 12741]|nr:glycosyltransferase family 2 protein [bacterium SCSIO 12741]